MWPDVCLFFFSIDKLILSQLKIDQFYLEQNDYFTEKKQDTGKLFLLNFVDVFMFRNIISQSLQHQLVSCSVLVSCP